MAYSDHGMALVTVRAVGAAVWWLVSAAVAEPKLAWRSQASASELRPSS